MCMSFIFSRTSAEELEGVDLGQAACLRAALSAALSR